MTVDPITLQVIQARLAGIVQEMQNSLFRTGYSTIIRESQDASCAVLNTRGEVIAQHVVLPLHMGAFPACAEAILKTFSADDIHDGDAFITNHPYLGGSPHAPDMGVFTPIFFAVNGSASPLIWPTKATSAARCPAAAAARRGKFTRKACICRR